MAEPVRLAGIGRKLLLVTGPELRRSGRRWQAVELIVERAAGLDVGKDEVMASHPRP